MAFLDFGIVGRVPPRIWTALRDAGASIASEDYKGLAQALCDMGAADSVDIDQFATDLGSLDQIFGRRQPADRPAGGGGRRGCTNRRRRFECEVLLKLVQLTERNGIKLPREFGLLVKQALYFDRYTKLLAPDLDLVRRRPASWGLMIKGRGRSTSR